MLHWAAVLFVIATVAAVLGLCRSPEAVRLPPTGSGRHASRAPPRAARAT
jgi:hypothetical protein